MKIHEKSLKNMGGETWKDVDESYGISNRYWVHI
jgi:hypothetical protein